jgi:hypothetical protein
MKKPLIATALLLGCTLSFVRETSTETANDQALDFLVQKVCVGANGTVQLIDPYYCPQGDSLLSLDVGEALPYHRFDQPSSEPPEARQRLDSIPVRARDGQIVVVNTLDHAPFDTFKPDRDGYDLYMVREGWASIGGTRNFRSGAGTWFGLGCKPYNGWVLFPLAALEGGGLVSPGEAHVPLHGVWWERVGQPWPGDCPTEYRNSPLTTWEPMRAFHFGGPDQATQKTIDAIRSIHGYMDDRKKWLTGHLEVFYFTRLYGRTRWESWAYKERFDADPSLQRKYSVASQRCSGPGENSYRGLTFVRIGCRDWTSVEVLKSPERPPAWPMPY